MIDVHIGFMDEEVSELLKCLIEKFGDERPVVAVERGKVITQDFLFETPFKKYVKDVKDVKIVHVNKDEDQSDIDIKAPLEDRLAHYLSKEMYSADEFIKDRIASRVLKTAKLRLKPDNITFSIIRFNPTPTATNDPIILVRNPEMGAQPSVVRPYERAIFKAISSLEEAHRPSSGKVVGPGVRLYSFASGGAIKPGLLPGDITRPLASLYIGSEVDEHGRVYSVVNLAAIRKIPPKLWPQHVEFYRDETAKTYVWGDLSGITQDPAEMKKVNKEVNEQVKNSVQWFVLDSGDALLEATLDCLSSCYRHGSFKYTPISDDGKKLSEEIPQITASFSYFDDLTTKKRLAEKLKGVVINSNMEDYHVLRLARSMVERGGRAEDGVIAPHEYAQLIDVDILRVNANVNVPIEKMKECLFKYLTTIRLTRDEYIKSIMWGLKGCPLNEITELPDRVNQWGLYNALKYGGNEDLLEYIYAYKDKKNTYCMDPFCCEIATDLLKELANTDNKFPEELRNAAAEAIQEAKKHTWDDDWNSTAELVGKLVDLMQTDYADKESIGGSMYCWLRPGGKWNGIDGNKMLDSNAVNGFLENEENVDRLFYKSANLLALQRLAHIAADRSEIPK
jgi:hypothetical protein